MRQSAHLHTIAKLSHEKLSAIVEANEPLIVLLEYTLTSNSALAENSIQARFGRHRLPTTIIDADVVISNVCNVVAMQIHFALVSVSVKLYTSVSRLPVDVVSDGVEHLAFDFTHDLKRFVNLRLVWRKWGAIATPYVPVCLLVSEHAEMGIHHEVDHLIGGRAIETLTEPVNRQISGCHGIEEEVLQVLQVLVREEVVCHVTIIGTGSADSRG